MTDYKQPPSHEENWTALLGRLAPLAAPGSALLLDYPSGEACARTDRASALAAAAYLRAVRR